MPIVQVVFKTRRGRGCHCIYCIYCFPFIIVVVVYSCRYMPIVLVVQVVFKNNVGAEPQSRGAASLRLPPSLPLILTFFKCFFSPAALFSHQLFVILRHAIYCDITLFKTQLVWYERIAWFRRARLAPHRVGWTPCLPPLPRAAPCPRHSHIIIIYIGKDNPQQQCLHTDILGFQEQFGVKTRSRL